MKEASKSLLQVNSVLLENSSPALGSSRPAFFFTAWAPDTAPKPQSSHFYLNEVLFPFSSPAHLWPPLVPAKSRWLQPRAVGSSWRYCHFPRSRSSLTSLATPAPSGKGQKPHHHGFVVSFCSSPSLCPDSKPRSTFCTSSPHPCT